MGKPLFPNPISCLQPGQIVKSEELMEVYGWIHQSLEINVRNSLILNDLLFLNDQVFLTE